MPDKEATFHQHPSNIHDQVYGVKLVAGDVLEPTDVYNSSNGFWEQCTCPGIPLGEGTATIWIRPLDHPPGAVYYEPRPGSPRPLPTAARARAAAELEAARVSARKAAEESESDESAES